MDGYDAAHLLHVARTLRVLNAVRAKHVGMPDMYATYEPTFLLYRLATRHMHATAVDMCRYVGVRPDAVLHHWARAKVAAARHQPHGEEDARLGEVILRKFADADVHSFADIARAAFEAGRPRIATALLEHEVCAADQVLLLLEMDEHRLALAKAVECGDADLIYHVLFRLQRSMSRGEFFRIVQEVDCGPERATDGASVGLRPSSRATYATLAARLLEAYAKEQDEELLRDFYYQDDRHCDAAVRCIVEALQRVPSERAEGLRQAQRHFGDDAARGTEARLVHEACTLLGVQATLDAELASLGSTARTLGSPLYATIETCLAHHLTRRAERLKHDFGVSDARYFATRVHALVHTQNFDALWKATARRSHAELVVAALLAAGHLAEAARHVTRVTDKATRARLSYVPSGRGGM